MHVTDVNDLIIKEIYWFVLQNMWYEFSVDKMKIPSKKIYSNVNIRIIVTKEWLYQLFLLCSFLKIFIQEIDDKCLKKNDHFTAFQISIKLFLSIILF